MKQARVSEGGGFYNSVGGERTDEWTDGPMNGPMNGPMSWKNLSPAENLSHQRGELLRLGSLRHGCALGVVERAPLHAHHLRDGVEQRLVLLARVPRSQCRMKEVMKHTRGGTHKQGRSSMSHAFTC